MQKDYEERYIEEKREDRQIIQDLENGCQHDEPYMLPFTSDQQQRIDMIHLSTHRDTNPTTAQRIVLFNAMVARAVGDAELKREPNVIVAREKEWNKLREQCVWDDLNPRNWEEVKQEALTNGFDVHFDTLWDYVQKTDRN